MHAVEGGGFGRNRFLDAVLIDECCMMLLSYNAMTFRGSDFCFWLE